MIIVVPQTYYIAGSEKSLRIRFPCCKYCLKCCCFLRVFFSVYSVSQGFRVIIVSEWNTPNHETFSRSLGRQFNKDGNLARWWSNKSIAAFKNKTACLEKQYSGYKFHGKNVSMISEWNKKRNNEKRANSRLSYNSQIIPNRLLCTLWLNYPGNESFRTKLHPLPTDPRKQHFHHSFNHVYSKRRPDFKFEFILWWLFRISPTL